MLDELQPAISDLQLLLDLSAGDLCCPKIDDPVSAGLFEYSRSTLGHRKRRTGLNYLGVLDSDPGSAEGLTLHMEMSSRLGPNTSLKLIDRYASTSKRNMGSRLSINVNGWSEAPVIHRSPGTRRCRGIPARSPQRTRTSRAGTDRRRERADAQGEREPDDRRENRAVGAARAERARACKERAQPS